MSNEITLFDFEGNEVRIVMQDGDPWWIAVDVCRVLGIENTTQAVETLDDDDRITLSNTEVIAATPT